MRVLVHTCVYQQLKYYKYEYIKMYIDTLGHLRWCNG